MRESFLLDGRSSMKAILVFFVLKIISISIKLVPDATIKQGLIMLREPNRFPENLSLADSINCFVLMVPMIFDLSDSYTPMQEQLELLTLSCVSLLQWLYALTITICFNGIMADTIDLSLKSMVEVIISISACVNPLFDHNNDVYSFVAFWLQSIRLRDLMQFDQGFEFVFLEPQCAVSSEQLIQCDCKWVGYGIHDEHDSLTISHNSAYFDEW